MSFLTRLLKKNALTSVLHHTLFLYPVPLNINYFWNFGFLALITLGIQIISGILLAMYYVPTAADAFNSVEFIMRELSGGWLLRYCHANGASMFFIVVFIHIFRGLYYSSYVYPRVLLWNTGVIILLIMILTAFLGYVLPWGQMSFWAATVITNLVSIVPFIGNLIMYWLWGGFAVSGATLNKFFSLHFLFPFILLFLSLLHVAILHVNGSNNPLGFDAQELIYLTPYSLIKDQVSLIFYLFLFLGLVSFSPNFVNHSDNYIMANPLSTPAHIVPEWYLLSFYAILRSIPHKTAGVIALVMAILILMFLPFITTVIVRSSIFRPFYELMVWFFGFDCILLSYLGGNAAEEPFIYLSQCCTFIYFFFFIVIFPFVAILDYLIILMPIRNKANETSLKFDYKNIIC